MHKFFPNPPSVLSRGHTAPRRGFKFISLVAVCLAACLGSIATSSAQVSVTPVVTLNMGVYTYSYSVSNAGSNPLAIVSFGAMPTGAFTVQNLTAPMGFIATYDSGNGFVSFLEDNDPATPQTFAPGTTVTPFTFTSTFAPGATSFEALDSLGNTFTGVTQAPVPEPGTLALFLLALPGIGLLLHRRRQIQRATITAS